MIKIQWSDTQQNIVIWTFSDQWTWNDFYTAQNEVQNRINKVNGIVDSIFITPQQQKVPSSAISHFRKIITKRHNRHDMLVVVGSSMFLSALLNMVIKFIPSASHQFHFVSTQDEAYKIIEQTRLLRKQSS